MKENSRCHLRLLFSSAIFPCITFYFCVGQLSTVTMVKNIEKACRSQMCLKFVSSPDKSVLLYLFTICAYMLSSILYQGFLSVSMSEWVDSELLHVHLFFWLSAWYSFLCSLALNARPHVDRQRTTDSPSFTCQS